MRMNQTTSIRSFILGSASHQVKGERPEERATEHSESRGEGAQGEYSFFLPLLLSLFLLIGETTKKPSKKKVKRDDEAARAPKIEFEYTSKWKQDRHAEHMYARALFFPSSSSVSSSLRFHLTCLPVIILLL